MEPVHEFLDVLMDEGVGGDVRGPLGELRLVRQFAVEEQVGDLEVGALFGQLFDGISPVPQDPLVAVDERDLALARRGVHEGGIVGHHAEIIRVDLDLAQIGRLDGVVLDRDLVRFPGSIVRNGESVFLRFTLSLHSGSPLVSERSTNKEQR